MGPVLLAIIGKGTAENPQGYKVRYELRWDEVRVDTHTLGDRELITTVKGTGTWKSGSGTWGNFVASEVVEAPESARLGLSTIQEE